MASCRAALLLVAVVLAESVAADQTHAPKDESVWIHNGFGTARSYIGWSASERRSYAMGAVNGMLLAPLFGAQKDGVVWLERCTGGMTDDQVAAILSKYINDHPERWHDGLHVVSFSAMKLACDAR